MSQLPLIRPMPLKVCRDAFDDPAWLFEVKHDGFRGLAFIEQGNCRLVSRDGHRFSEFREVEESLAQALRGRTAILDGEIVCLDGQGRLLFALLLNRQACPYFYAFDLLWLDGQDCRRRPLLERKAALSRLIPRPYGRLLYLDHLEEHGRALYEAASKLDLEGIVAKRKESPYVSTRRRNWLKIKTLPIVRPKVGRNCSIGASCDLDFDGLMAEDGIGSVAIQSPAITAGF